MQIEVSVGEIVDKLTILEIKKENIQDPTKLDNIVREYVYLSKIVFEDLGVSMLDYSPLKEVNKVLWDIEDEIREKERAKVFDESFVDLARKVYITNDARAALKKEINIKYNSLFTEEKSYAKY